MGIAINPAVWAQAHQPPAYTLPNLPPGTPQVPSSPAPTPGSYTGPGGIRGDIAAALPPPSGAMPTPGGGISQQLPPPNAPGAAPNIPPPMAQPRGPVSRTRRSIADILTQVMQRGG